jgi:hypothetical protein
VRHFDNLFWTFWATSEFAVNCKLFPLLEFIWTIESVIDELHINEMVRFSSFVSKC